MNEQEKMNDEREKSMQQHRAPQASRIQPITASEESMNQNCSSRSNNSISVYRKLAEDAAMPPANPLKQLPKSKASERQIIRDSRIAVMRFDPMSMKQPNTSDPLADVLSSSVASFVTGSNARRAVDMAEARSRKLKEPPPVLGGERAASVVAVDSSSSSGEPSATRREAFNVSDSTVNSNRSRESGNLVTATTTTSSGDDPDSSGGNAGGGISGGATSEQSGPGSEVAHHHRSRRRPFGNDGSALQVPGDDGSHRLLGGPATVVASRLPPPNSDTSSGSGGEGENTQEITLLQPHREPGYHTIKRTLNRLPRRARGLKSAATDSSSQEDGIVKKIKAPKPDPSAKSKKKKTKIPRIKESPQKSLVTIAQAPSHDRGRGSPSPDSVNSNNAEGGGSSSGSGTEGGYAGSASSNENGSGQQESSSSSPSVSSSEESRPKSKRHRSGLKEPKASAKGERVSGDSSSSSEIADFSSGDSSGDFTIKAFTSVVPSASPSLSSSNEESLDGLEETYMRAKHSAEQDQARLLEATARKRKATVARAWGRALHAAKWPRPTIQLKDDSKMKANSKKEGRPPILTLGSDIMAHVLTFLQPPEILGVLTMPLSRDWRSTFTLQPELWRVLCLVEPFKAKTEIADDSDSSGELFLSLTPKAKKDFFEKRLLDRYRLLYTTFVRCMKYLSQIREDAINGRQPSFIDYGFAVRGSRNNGGPPTVVGTNKSLQGFLARARGVVEESKSESDENYDLGTQLVKNTLKPASSRKRKHSGMSKKKRAKKIKFGRSMITDRLLGPSCSGAPGNLNLPWSCAIYSIVNWMVAFLDVEGIQTLCMKVLPFLLEDEEQRLTAQRTGLTDVVLQGMVLFDKSVQLHIAAFHTIVLLARPLGGQEGMLFHSSMVASGIFGGEHSQHRKNGIAVMVDSMRRFEDNEVLQAMSCWALVNIALAPAQKAVLVKLGGIQATANAMLRHPFNAEVQFRALFALINLVIPSVSLNSESEEALAIQDQLGEVNDTTEKEIIDELVGEIADLVVMAMKNFCSSEAILNRACLVLHNLSLTQEYHTILLWTPNCYQMLDWCLANYRTDQVLQQSASGTLHRLQVTLSNDDDLRARFAECLQSQQQVSLEQAHREALRLHEQQNEILRRANDH